MRSVIGSIVRVRLTWPAARLRWNGWACWPLPPCCCPWFHCFSSGVTTAVPIHTAIVSKRQGRMRKTCLSNASVCCSPSRTTSSRLWLPFPDSSNFCAPASPAPKPWDGLPLCVRRQTICCSLWVRCSTTVSWRRAVSVCAVSVFCRKFSLPTVLKVSGRERRPRGLRLFLMPVTDLTVCVVAMLSEYVR